MGASKSADQERLENIHVLCMSQSKIKLLIRGLDRLRGETTRDMIRDKKVLDSLTKNGRNSEAELYAVHLAHLQKASERYLKIILKMRIIMYQVDEAIKTDELSNELVSVFSSLGKCTLSNGESIDIIERTLDSIQIDSMLKSNAIDTPITEEVRHLADELLEESRVNNDLNAFYDLPKLPHGVLSYSEKSASSDQRSVI